MKKQIDLKEIAKVLKKYPEIVVGYLFGSTVRGNTTPKSDVDLGVVFKNPQEIFKGNEFIRVRRKLDKDLSEIVGNKEVDIVFLQHSPLSLQFDAINDGKIVFERNPKYEVGYREYVLNYYLDFKFYQDYFDKLTFERLAYEPQVKISR